MAITSMIDTGIASKLCGCGNRFFSNRKKVKYYHLICAACGARPRLTVREYNSQRCPAFATPQGCKFGSACKKLHVSRKPPASNSASPTPLTRSLTPQQPLDAASDISDAGPASCPTSRRSSGDWFRHDPYDLEVTTVSVERKDGSDDDTTDSLSAGCSWGGHDDDTFDCYYYAC